MEMGSFLSVEPELRATLKGYVSQLLTSDEDGRAEIVESIVQLVGTQCGFSLTHPLYCEFSALIIDQMLGYFLDVKSSHESEFYHFLNLLNHVPITPESPYYQPILRSFKLGISSEVDLLQVFNQLQMLYILTENHDYENAENLFSRLEPLVSKEHLTGWVLMQLCRARLLRYKDDMPELMRMHLGHIMDAYCIDGCDCAINFLLKWIVVLNWQRIPSAKKTLLMQTQAKIGEQKSLNSAMVLYELFSMDEKQVPSSEKITYQRRLIKYPAAILNVHQLHNLYFFAGYYNCGVLSKFKESIQNYQYSNYFLHKSWERLLSLSRFMRDHLDCATYYNSMQYLDTRIKDLSNQVSLQNNAYVESLQANFDTIEDLYEKVGELSLTDSLTGLKNRRFLDSNLYQMVVLASRHHVPVCFSMLDIDFFKLINDSYGHLAGDFVLKELAKMFTNEFRKSDVVIRYGGEEFLIILFDSRIERCSTIMDELRKKVEKHCFEYRNKVIPTTISIGITCDKNIDPRHYDMTTIIAQADSALYKAKTSGRNRVEIYQPDSPKTENEDNR